MSDYIEKIRRADIRGCKIARAIVVVMIVYVEATMLYILASVPVRLYSLELGGIIMIYMLGGGVFVLRVIGKRLERLRNPFPPLNHSDL
jgi:hypothetical protein